MMLWAVYWSFTLIVAAYGKGSHGDDCAGADFAWMNNDDGESPCLVASRLASLCSPGGMPGALSLDIRDAVNTTKTPCTCNTVSYSLASACTYCQMDTPPTWTSWAQDCSSTADSLGSLPEELPKNLIVPLWAYNPIPITKSFDLGAAQSNATLTSYSDALANFDIQTSVVIASGITYGIALVLATHCAYDMVTSRHQTRRTRISHTVYIAVMAVLSTIAAAEVATFFWTAFSNNGVGDATSILFFKDYSAPTPLPFLILGADGFMIYRCQALYINVSRKYRAALFVLLSSLFLGLCATAVLFFFLPGNSWFGIILPTSTGVNVILSLLITLRTIRLQREHLRILGVTNAEPDSTPYSRITELCLESSSLMIFFGLILTILLARSSNGSQTLRAGGWILVPLMVFPHICVISPLLISYRVAHGHDVSSTTNSVSAAPIVFRTRSTRASSIAYIGLSGYQSKLDLVHVEATDVASMSDSHLHLPYQYDRTTEDLTHMQPSRQSTLDVVPESPGAQLFHSLPPLRHSRISSLHFDDTMESGIQFGTHYPFALRDTQTPVQPSRQSSINTVLMMPESPKSMLSVWRKKDGGYRRLPDPPVAATLAESETSSLPSRSTTLLSLSSFPWVSDPTASMSDYGSIASRVSSPSPGPPALRLQPSTGDLHARKLPSIPSRESKNV